MLVLALCVKLPGPPHAAAAAAAAAAAGKEWRKALPVHLCAQLLSAREDCLPGHALTL